MYPHDPLCMSAGVMWFRKVWNLYNRLGILQSLLLRRQYRVWYAMAKSAGGRIIWVEGREAWR